MRRHDQKGDGTEDDTNLIFQYMNLAYQGGTAPGLSGATYPGITAAGIACNIKLRLVGQLTFPSQNPSQLLYVRGSTCASSCPYAVSDVCSSTEISSECLLTSLSNDWLPERRASLENIFGDIDNVQLFSEDQFGGSTIGLAWVGAMCSTRLSSGVNQVSFSTAAANAAIAAHEMGHNFGSSHDSFGDFTIMAPSISEGNPATRWSSQSAGQVNTYMNSRYGVVYTSCLEIDAGTPNTTVCGNGRVDPGEECDLGVGQFNTVCLANCSYGPDFVECNQNATCCGDNGRFISADSRVLCRPSINAACDRDEFCDGVSQDCPTDFFETAGTVCQDVTANNVTDNDGLCFMGDCVSRADNCDVPPNIYAFVPTGNVEDACTMLRCRSDPSSGLGVEVTRSVSGTPCGTDRQCLAQSRECVRSGTIKFYRYVQVSAGCYKCQDESGVEVDDSRCETANPSTPGACDAGTGGDGSGGGGGDGGGLFAASMLVITVLAVVLGVGCVFTCVYCCKSKRKVPRTRKRANSTRRRSATNAAVQAFDVRPMAQSVRSAGRSPARTPARSRAGTVGERSPPGRARARTVGGRSRSPTKHMQKLADGRKKKNRPVKHFTPTNSAREPLPEGWTRHFSDAGIPYFFNTSSGESRWDRPLVMDAKSSQRPRSNSRSPRGTVGGLEITSLRGSYNDSFVPRTRGSSAASRPTPKKTSMFLD